MTLTVQTDRVLVRASAHSIRLTSELGETLEVVAPAATLHIETQNGLRAEVLNQFATIREPDRLIVRLGDLVSGQEVPVVVRLEFPSGQEGTHIAAKFSMRSEDGQSLATAAEQEWRFASHAACDAQWRNQAVDEAVGAV